ncbi:MAG: hypothetical protein B6241_05620 [Spirochaetaceae bacterium 4572_59]|nr:MAG: hypothetical protein B6241_05620 [Spirochaetaceae bacterium 4572_59]
MADISIPGLNSKYNTETLIKGLVDVEKVKMTQMENSIKDLEDDKKIWQEFNRKISTLRTSTKKLYGFENPFNDKTVESSNERILTASATREATQQDLKFTVIKTAGADRFISPALDDDLRVPQGTYSFSVAEEEFSLRYRGGRLSDFAERVEKKSNGLLNITVVKDTSSTQVILFESQKTGIENKLVFKDDALTWALENNLLKESETESNSIQFDKIIKEDLLTDKTVSLSGENTLILSAGASIDIPLNGEISYETGMFLEYDITVNELDPESMTPTPPPLPVLPDTPDAIFRGVKVESFDSSASPPPWNAPPPPPLIEDNLIGTFSSEDGISNLPQIQEGSYTENVRFPLSGSSQTLKELSFNNRNTYKEIQISNIKITDPRTDDAYIPVNALSLAQNAVLEFSGIRIERETNDIDDLIPGITLELKRADPDEEVELSIKPDIEKAKEEIIKFVYNYNQTMTQMLILSSDNSDIINEIEYFSDDEREKAFEQLGAFRGDITMMQMKNRLQRVSSSPYPTSLERDLSMLTQIGISTNASGGSGGGVNSSKLRGYLEINEDLLDKSLTKMSPAIKELFGMDTDGDLVIDSGVGYELDRFLNPYVRTGGILPNKVTLIDNRIDDTNEDIDDYKEYLEDYEQTLKRKYGTMESMLNQLEQSSSSIDSFGNSQKNQ